MKKLLILTLVLVSSLVTANDKIQKRSIASEDETKLISYFENRIADLQVMYRQMDLSSQWEFKPVLSKSIELLSLTRASYFFGKIDDSIPCTLETKDASDAFSFTMKISNLLRNKDLSASESKSLMALLSDSEKMLESKNSKQLACIKKFAIVEKLDNKVDLNALKVEFSNLLNQH